MTYEWKENKTVEHLHAYPKVNNSKRGRTHESENKIKQVQTTLHGCDSNKEVDDKNGKQNLHHHIF